MTLLHKVEEEVQERFIVISISWILITVHLLWWILWTLFWKLCVLVDMTGQFELKYYWRITFVWCLYSRPWVQLIKLLLLALIIMEDFDSYLIRCPLQPAHEKLW